MLHRAITKGGGKELEARNWTLRTLGKDNQTRFNRAELHLRLRSEMTEEEEGGKLALLATTREHGLSMRCTYLG